MPTSAFPYHDVINQQHCHFATRYRVPEVCCIGKPICHTRMTIYICLYSFLCPSGASVILNHQLFQIAHLRVVVVALIFKLGIVSFNRRHHHVRPVWENPTGSSIRIGTEFGLKLYDTIKCINGHCRCRYRQ
ncbi:hypothetical protein JCM21531_1343 [Acetivibrio straminisolvens JCM 21531]|uniref:Uncharacterized protein n=1 Tax=Acetivibrio straminisolvens JCM 21531 TaxID=1294263 RepID=W4V3C9_9FIRM|nr:hypothetical protein JCM21531_1343 [Acetivibrio straminisolvens JCM 21531]